MSNVPQYKRKESKLNAEKMARTLAVYTVQICSNTKVFPEKYQELLTIDIVREAKDIFLNTFAANNTVVSDSITAEERLTLQVKAITGCRRLMPLVDLAYKVYHLKSSRVEYWGRLIISCRELLIKWHSSDIERYPSMLK